MKSTLVTLTTVASFAGYANANLMFKEPWSQSKPWKSGNPAHITWTSEAADSSKLCDIQMLNGDATNSNVVATVTNPKNPVKCGTNAFEIAPLNDFKTGKYWLRIGQADTNTWTYSGVFNFEGEGTAAPLRLADGTTSYPSAEAPKNGKKDNKGASPSASASGSAKSTMPSASSSSGLKSISIASGKEQAPTDAAKAPTVKKENTSTEHEKKSNSGVGFQLSLTHHAMVMGLASLAAYAFTV